MNLGAYRPKNPLPEMIPQAAPGAAPGSAFTPAAGVIDSVPQMYPGGPTDLGFLYAQLQKVPFLGAFSTFTANQTIHVTSPGETLGALKLHITDSVDGTGDPTAIRPAALILQHDSTLAVVGGIGASIFYQTLDANGATVRIGKEACEITDGTPAACISSLAWCVQKSGTEVEVFRLRGSQGMAPTFFSGGSMADGGGTAGKVGGQFWVRGDLLTTGDSVHQKTDAVTNAPLRLKTYEHLLSTGSVAAGFGTEHYWQSRDGSNNLVPLGRHQVLVGTPTAGAVDSLHAWSITMGGIETEVFRLTALGPSPANFGGITGKGGGRFWCVGDFKLSPADAVTNAPLRIATYEHILTSGVVAAGFGTEQYWQTRDAANNLVAMGRQQALVTTPTAAAVDTAMCWSISRGGSEVEVFRAAGLGMASTVDTSITGNVGGLLWVRGDFRHSGTSLGFYNAATTTKPTVTGSRGSNAALASLLSALATLGLLTDSSS